MSIPFLSLSSSIAQNTPLGSIESLETIVQYCFLVAFLIVFIRFIRDTMVRKIPFKIALQKRTATFISILIMYIIVGLLMALN
ncbi:hypothetical protein ACYSNM_04995 [Myroides sp. LJL116]